MDQRYNLNWTDGPPKKELRRMLRIAHAPKDGCLDLVILSDHLVGIWTHWVGGRTQPCSCGHGCVCERENVTSRWKGYLACCYVTNGKMCLAELTGEAARCISLQDSPLTGQPLRGLTLRLRRDRQSRGGRVIAGIVSGERFDTAALPACPDVHAELVRIWTSAH